MTLREYLCAFKSWLLAAGLVLGLLCAAAFTLLTTPKYAANTTLFISAQGLQNDAGRAYQGELLAEEKTKTYAELIMSDQFRTEVGNQLHIEIAPGHIIATTQPQTVLITTTVTDASPRQAQQIADAVDTEFVALVAQLEKPSDNPTAPPTAIAQVVQSAQLPLHPISPRPAWDLAVGATLGLLLGYTISLLRHVLNTSPLSAGQHRQVAGSPAPGGRGSPTSAEDTAVALGVTPPAKLTPAMPPGRATATANYGVPAQSHGLGR
ncbi:MAG: YveK family protein [Pseudonocardiaceae bacterium]